VHGDGKKIFGSKRGQVGGGCRKLHIEVLHYLYYTPNIIRAIKSRTIRWAEHAARMVEKRNAYRRLKEKEYN
jgi:hypothetical protein